MSRYAARAAGRTGLRRRSQGRVLPRPGALAVPDRPLSGQIRRGAGIGRGSSSGPHSRHLRKRRLETWDRAAAASADRYLVNSRASGEAVLRIYGIARPKCWLLHRLSAPAAPCARCVASSRVTGCAYRRLLPYKNIDLVIEAVRAVAGGRLVDSWRRTRNARGSNPWAERAVTFLRGLGDDQLRWCYANCKALLTASYEDFGLTPLEVAAFGKPTAAPRFGGFLDTIVEGRTGVFFERPDSRLIMDAMHQLDAVHWDSEALKQHADGFGEERFGERLREVVAEESAKLS